jgi:hypothetical protein
MMVRVLALIALAGCASPKPAPKPLIADDEHYDSSAAWTHAPEDPGCTETTFDPSNPNCELVCTRIAPQGWFQCEQLADRLIARGYVCQRRTPYACQLPPGGILANIKSWRSIENTASIKIDAGTNDGVALTWSGTLVDSERRPLDDFPLVIVNEDESFGAPFPTPAIQAAAAVWLHP